MSSDSSIDDVEQGFQSWYPRDILRWTNCLYRVDALHPHDIRDMSVLWELTELFQYYATQFIAWAYSIRSVISHSSDHIYAERLENVVKLIIKMLELFWSKGYCYILDYLQVAYYPIMNQITRRARGLQFPNLTRQTIDCLGNSEARELTGLSSAQLSSLCIHLRMPNTLSYQDRH